MKPTIRPRVAIVLPTKHSSHLKRAELFSSLLSPEFAVDVYRTFRRNDESMTTSWARNIRVLVALVRQRYAVVHVLGLSFLVPRLLKAVGRGTPKIVYDTGNVEIGIMETLGRSRSTRTVVRWLESLSVKDSDLVIARGVTFADFFSKHYGGTACVRYVPDPVDLTMYSITTPEPEERSPAEAIPGRLRVVYASNFENIRVRDQMKPRGWELIEAVAQEQDHLSDLVEIHFVGTGSALPALRNLAEARGVMPCCKFLGFLSEPDYVSELRSADVGFMEDYASLGYRYSVGSKVQEYMAAGLPVITGNSPEKNYLLQNQGISDLVIDPLALDDPLGAEKYLKDLGRALRYSLGHKPEGREAGTRNRSRAEKVFDVEKVTASLRTAYRELVPSAFAGE